MHLDRHQSVEYMKDVGYPMSERSLYRWKQHLNTTKRERLYEIARIGYEDEHTDSIEEIELARKLMWKEYYECKGSVSRATILEKIINTRPLLSSYYDSTKEVIERPGSTTTKEDNSDLQTDSAETETKPWTV